MFLATSFLGRFPRNRPWAGLSFLESIFVGQCLRTTILSGIVACISNAHNNLKQMIKYLCGFCFLLGFTGLPVQAKWTVPEKSTTTSPSKVTGSRVLPSADASRTASSTQQKAKVEPVVLTRDVPRAPLGTFALGKTDSTQPSEKVAPPAERTVAKIAPPLVNTKAAPQGNPVASTVEIDTDHGQPETRFARVTAYWAAEGDYYTGRGLSATGVRLHDGLCAVDPNIIPYGSVVEIAGLGKYLAVDTGSAVIARLAARESGHTSEERGAIVVDIFFESRRDGEEFAAAAAKYTPITWWAPTATNTMARVARSLFADENWLKIQSKQL
jgi:3D (Asp-Asp-Asp) domain-containing protein